MLLKLLVLVCLMHAMRLEAKLLFFLISAISLPVAGSLLSSHGTGTAVGPKQSKMRTSPSQMSRERTRAELTQSSLWPTHVTLTLFPPFPPPLAARGGGRRRTIVRSCFHVVLSSRRVRPSLGVDARRCKSPIMSSRCFEVLPARQAGFNGKLHVF